MGSKREAEAEGCGGVGGGWKGEACVGRGWFAHLGNPSEGLPK